MLVPCLSLQGCFPATSPMFMPYQQTPAQELPLFHIHFPHISASYCFSLFSVLESKQKKHMKAKGTRGLSKMEISVSKHTFHAQDRHRKGRS